MPNSFLEFFPLHIKFFGTNIFARKFSLWSFRAKKSFKIACSWSSWGRCPAPERLYVFWPEDWTRFRPRLWRQRCSWVDWEWMKRRRRLKLWLQLQSVEILTFREFRETCLKRMKTDESLSDLRRPKAAQDKECPFNPPTQFPPIHQ